MSNCIPVPKIYNIIVHENVQNIQRKGDAAMNILLCCGAGMSSGFMAQSVRKAALKRGIQVRCDAYPQANIDRVIKNYDILCLGPFLGATLEKYQNIASRYDVPVIVIPSSIYGKINGDALYELCCKELLKEGSK